MQEERLGFREPMVDQKRTAKQLKSPQMTIDCKEKMGYPALVSATARCSDFAWMGRIRNAKVASGDLIVANHVNGLSLPQKTSHHQCLDLSSSK